jgi:hypothetical protein
VRRIWIVGALAIGACISACTSQGNLHAAGKGSIRKVTTMPTTSIVGTTTSVVRTTVPSTTTPSGPGGCIPGDVKITISKGLAAGGDEGAVIAFGNASQKSCVLQGYPSVIVYTLSGNATNVTDKLSGYLGGVFFENGPPSVYLQPGGSASAILEASDTGINGMACSTYSYILVGLPNSQANVRLPATLPNQATSLPDCSGEEVLIHPIVPGDSGSLPPPL